MIFEIWKPVTNYEGLYEVSNLGRVRSLDFKRTGKERVLKPGTDTKGYLRVILYKNGEKAIKKVSRLVAEAFIPNPENKPTVDHINKQRDDDRVENLQWFTYGENNKKAYDQGRVISDKQKSACAKMGKASQIISTWFNEKLNQEFTGNLHELVRFFPEQKLSSGNLSEVRNGKQKHHKGWTIKS